MLPLLLASAVLFTNAEVLTMDPARPRARALLVEGERISAVGGDAEVRAVAPRDARVVDLGGAAVVPGFNDAHLHVGLGLSLADAVPVPSERRAFLAEIRRRAGRLAPGEWLFAIASDGLPSGVETGAPLDGVTDRPVFVVSPRGGLMNGAGVNATRLNDHLPWGFVRGRWVAPVLEVIALSRPRAELEQVAREFLADAARYGLTSVQALNDQFPDLFEDLRRRGELTTRVRFVPLGLSLDQHYRVPTWTGPAPSWVRVDGVKYFHDEDGRLDRRVLREAVRRSIADRRRMVVHVRGRNALSGLLDLVERLTGGERALASLFRIDHADVVPPDEARRMRRLGITVCSNATLAAEEVHRERLFPMRSLLDQGVSFCLASDWLGRRTHPRSLDPLRAVRFAATRPGPERITVLEALRAYTAGAARAEGMEADKGTLARGKLADLVVLSRDPTALPPERLGDVRVVLAMVGGRVVRSDLGSREPGLPERGPGVRPGERRKPTRRPPVVP